MTDYGKGSVLGAATVLPSTTAAGFILAGKVDSLIIAGLFTISALSLVMLVGYISRYAFNRKGN